MRDLLDAVAIEMPCPSCGRNYTVSLRQVRGGQEMLDEGCGVRHFEDCPPAWWCRLLPAASVLQLEGAVRTIEAVAHQAGGRLVWSRGAR